MTSTPKHSMDERQDENIQISQDSNFTAGTFEHTKTHEMMPSAKLKGRVDDFKPLKGLAMKNGGHYNDARYAGTFLFKDALMGPSKFSKNGSAYDILEKISFPEESTLKGHEKHIADFGKSLGVPVIFFDGPSQLHGFHNNGITFLNRRSATSLPWTFWYETFHWLRNNNPELYQKMVGYINGKEQFSPGKLQEYRDEIGRPELSDAETIEEMMADAMPDVKKRVSFMKGLGKESPSLAQRFVAWIRRIMDKFRDALHRPLAGLTTAQSEAMRNAFANLAADMVDADGKRIFRVTGKEREIRTAKGEPLVNAQLSLDNSDKLANNEIKEIGDAHKNMLLRTINKRIDNQIELMRENGMSDDDIAKMLNDRHSDIESKVLQQLNTVYNMFISPRVNKRDVVARFTKGMNIDQTEAGIKEAFDKLQSNARRALEYGQTIYRETAYANRRGSDGLRTRYGVWEELERANAKHGGTVYREITLHKKGINGSASEIRSWRDVERSRAEREGTYGAGEENQNSLTDKHSDDQGAFSMANDRDIKPSLDNSDIKGDNDGEKISIAEESKDRIFRDVVRRMNDRADYLKHNGNTVENIDKEFADDNSNSRKIALRNFQTYYNQFNSSYTNKRILVERITNNKKLTDEQVNGLFDGFKSKAKEMLDYAGFIYKESSIYGRRDGKNVVGFNSWQEAEQSNANHGGTYGTEENQNSLTDKHSDDQGAFSMVNDRDIKPSLDNSDIKDNNDGEKISNNDSTAQAVFDKYLASGIQKMLRDTVTKEIGDHVDVASMNDPIARDEARENIPYIKKMNIRYNVLTGQGNRQDYIDHAAVEIEYARRVFDNDERIRDGYAREMDRNKRQAGVHADRENSNARRFDGRAGEELRGINGRLSPATDRRIRGEHQEARQRFNELYKDMEQKRSANSQGAFSIGKEQEPAGAPRRIYNALLNLIGLGDVKLASNVEQREAKGSRTNSLDNLGMLDLWGKAVRQVARKNEAVRLFYKRGRRAYSEQEHLRNEYAGALRRFNAYTKNDQDREDAASILWEGDAAEHAFTVKELKERGLSDNAIKVIWICRAMFSPLKETLDKVSRLLD